MGGPRGARHCVRTRRPAAAAAAAAHLCGKCVIKVKVKVGKSLHRLNFPVLTSSFRPLFDLPDAPSAVPPTSVSSFELECRPDLRTTCFFNANPLQESGGSKPGRHLLRHQLTPAAAAAAAAAFGTSDPLAAAEHIWTLRFVLV